jgi:predicted transcriptional regulator
MKRRIDINRTAAGNVRIVYTVAAVREGVRDAERGRFVSHERLKAKWEKRLAAALDGPSRR